jgi:hypothetical protein
LYNAPHDPYDDVVRRLNRPFFEAFDGSGSGSRGTELHVQHQHARARFGKGPSPELTYYLDLPELAQRVPSWTILITVDKTCGNNRDHLSHWAQILQRAKNERSGSTASYYVVFEFDFEALPPTT